eukprot:jgi/Hompol1/1200/HPOL_004541-RA
MSSSMPTPTSTSTSTSAIPSPTSNSTGVSPIITLQDDSLTGLLLWISILLVVGVVSISIFEVIRRGSKLSHVYYTRCKTSASHAPEFPSRLFGWVSTAIWTPDSYVKENVGLDAFMFILYLRMAFQLFAVLCVVSIVVLIPGDNPDMTAVFNVTTPDAILLVATQSLDFFSIDHVANGSNALWVHVFGAYFVSLLTYYQLYRCYKTYTTSLEGYLSGDVSVERSDEVMFRSIMITHLSTDLQHEAALRHWLNSLQLGEIEHICMIANDDASILDLMKRRDELLLQIEKHYMSWAINLARELGPKSLSRRFLRPSITTLVKLHTQVLNFPDEGMNNDMIFATRPVRIKNTSKGLVRQDLIRLREAMMNDLTERIIWARTKVVATSALVKESPLDFKLPDHAKADFRMVGSPERAEELIPSQTPTETSKVVGIDPGDDGASHSPENIDRPTQLGGFSRNLTSSATNIAMSALHQLSTVMGSFGSGLNINLSLYSQLNACSCSAFVTFTHRRSAFMARQLLLHRFRDPYTMQVHAAPSPKDVQWSSLAASLMGTVFKRSVLNAASYAICLFWVIPTSYISSFTQLDTLGRQPEYREFVTSVSKYPWLYALVSTVGPPLIIQLCNMLMPYLLEWLSSFQCLASRHLEQENTMAKYFFFLIFNVHFVFTLFTAASSSTADMFVNPLAWIQNIATSLPSGASFFINYLILNIALVPVELLRPFACIYHLYSRLWLTTPREFFQLNVMTSMPNYAFMYPMHILVFVVVICYSIISPIVLIPGAIYFGAALLILKNQM